MRVLVCGDRNFTDRTKLFVELDNRLFHTPWSGMTVIEGDARGADKLAGEYALAQGYELEVYPADWDKYGKGAGPIRNKQMLVEGKPDKVIAFLAPNSKGTANMIKQAQEAGVPVEIINV